jgi:hypothetical protein
MQKKFPYAPARLSDMLDSSAYGGFFASNTFIFNVF